MQASDYYETDYPTEEMDVWVFRLVGPVLFLPRGTEGRKKADHVNKCSGRVVECGFFG